ncbi:hypothetical protein ACS0TY_002976 [Phlomoides rotata]
MRILLFLLVAFLQVFGIPAFTNSNDYDALKSVADKWGNEPPNWVGKDPCGSNWEGISCTNDRVTSITLASINLSGKLSPDIGKLSELRILDLSYNKDIVGSLPSSIGKLTSLTAIILVGCGFSGPIPPSIGSLQNLVYLSLNSNNFTKEIPPSLGQLSNLDWLDLADNELTGNIPVSRGSRPGLDMLLRTKHFHFGKNQLSGGIPSQLFSSKMQLTHLLLENNQLTGSIPSSLGLVQSLTVVRLDKNDLSGPVPENLNNLTSIQELYLANNKLIGPIPDLTGMYSINYVDLSHNPFDATDVPPWFSSLPSLTSLMMESTNVEGEIPVSLFRLSQLQTVVLKNNKINGTLDIGSSNTTQLQLIDLQNNFIVKFDQQAGYSVGKIILAGNPVCMTGGSTQNYCTIPILQPKYSTPPKKCTPFPCDQEIKVASPTCKCAIPLSGNLIFRAPSFSNLENSSVYESLEQKLTESFKLNRQPVDSVSLSSPTKDPDDYLVLNLHVFPSGQEFFNRTGTSGISFMLSNQTFKPPDEFGPFFYIGEKYPLFIVVLSPNKSLSTSVIIGAAAGGSVLILLLAVAGAYTFHQKRRAAKKSNPFASWDPNSDSGGVPQLKEVKSFSFEEIKKCTNNFSETNGVGSGGYGKVYRGTLPDGQVVAIKRAQLGSMQGRLEFKTEIELLSRVHHKNVVSLVGFCFDKGEQMLVYEYIINGTLTDSLTGKRGIKLDWMRRLKIAVGAARGVQYLHDLANPPIIHRDIKSNNILLDESLNAKVADFGLSKPMDEAAGRSYVITQVKGTVGYLDPEYYMTQQLTEKSDVYSFGVLLFEILTSRTPIVKGKYILREVRVAMDKSKKLYNLEPILDPIVASNMLPGSVERFVDVALRCVQETGANRPTMSEVVKEIESIMEMEGLNLSTEESASTSDSFQGANKGSAHPYQKLTSQTHASNYSSTMTHASNYSPTMLQGR